MFFSLAGLELMSGCRHGPNVGTTAGSPAAHPEIWEYATRDGDKPGTGLRLRVSGTEITGTFYLLDPNRPNDFAAAGQVVPLTDFRKNGRSFTFTVLLRAANGPYPQTLSLSLDRELEGAVGDTVAGKLRSTDGPSEAVNVLLVRRE